MTGRCEQGNPFAARQILFQNLILQPMRDDQTNE